MGPPRDLAIRPLGIGEVIDRSVALTRRHFRALFLAMICIEAPVLALGRLQALRAGDLLAVAGDASRAGSHLRSLASFSAAALALLVALQLAATAVAAAIVAPSLDPSAPPSRAARPR